MPTKTPKLTIEQFLALPQIEQRRAIAQDAINQIKEGRYNVLSSYGYFHLDVPQGWKGGDLRDLLLTELPPCKVCGLGACFTSIIRLKDDFQIVHRNYTSSPAAAASQETHVGITKSARFDSELFRYFDPTDLERIEAAFEMCMDHCEYVTVSNFDEDDDKYDLHRASLYSAMNFGGKYVDDEDRLLAILQRIVDHPEARFTFE